jgi:hypothetical protein
MAIPIYAKIAFCCFMGKWCQNCGKLLKNPRLTHCSDECLMKSITKSKTVSPDEKGAETWDDKSDPWI